MKQTNSAMREAFLNARVAVSAAAKPVVVQVINSLSSKAGIKQAKEWDAKLSFRTASSLKKGGYIK